MTKRERALRDAKLRRKQRAATANKDRSSAIGVSGGFRAGKRKRGNSHLKQSPAESRATNITRDQVRAAPSDAVLYGNKLGIGKLLTYKTPE